MTHTSTAQETIQDEIHRFDFQSRTWVAESIELAPAPQLSPARPASNEIRENYRYGGEWIPLRHPEFSIFISKTKVTIRAGIERRTVDLNTLPRDQAFDLVDAVEEAWHHDSGERNDMLRDMVRMDIKMHEDAGEPIPDNLIELKESLEPEEPQEKPDPIIELLNEREFDPDNEPDDVQSIYCLGDVVISTPQNLDSITATVKVGKSSVLAAMMASTMSTGRDCLGFTSSNPDNHALLHFDSEQSPDDHWRLIKSMLRRADIENRPPWFHSYYLAGLRWFEAWECVKADLKRSEEDYGGIHSVFLDGIADFVRDVNDAGACNDFVAELHDLAIRYHCPIIGVIHFNPGSDKSRGHLGSQFERKAETNLRLDKDNGVTTIWSDKQRRAPIAKNCGPCFEWSDEHGMHVTAQTRKSAKEEAERDRLHQEATDVFGDHPALRYTDLKVAIQTQQKVSTKTAERRIERMEKLGVVQKTVANLYERKA